MSESETDEVSLILEVEGDVQKHATYIEKHIPKLDVVTTYNVLFQGIAVKGELTDIEKVAQLDFILASYPVQTYVATDQTNLQPNSLEDFQQNMTDTQQRSFHLTSDKEDDHIVLPNEINDTNFTGKGITVGVVDTGIDYTHPDLRANFAGGFDLVELDDDPMETKDVLPTLHGTHVAGIIAANGTLQGVAPDADIMAYRALGPGGTGTSIQVMAAMEEAVRDGVDIINLSLGNTVNGPDYPTSKAVNEASKQGVAVVVANGNAGPENWTVGAPATSAAAMAVGAYEAESQTPVLSITQDHKKIPLNELPFAPVWKFDRDYEITSEQTNVKGKFALVKVEEKTIAEDVATIEENEAEAIILYEEKVSETNWLQVLMEENINIPVALVSLKNGRWLKRHLNENKIYAKTTYEPKPEGVAEFSSRGPVTMDWAMKPDIIAPGVQIVSTVPGGYDALNGTSMAAPHVAGAIAVMKEAKPDWTNEQIFAALKTTAKQVETDDGNALSPVDQGAGFIQLSEAIDTDLLVYSVPLSFGKVADHLHERKQTITIENKSDEEKQFRFQIPKVASGLSWDLPQQFTVASNEEKEIPIKLKTNSLLLKEGIFQGWLTLEEKDKKMNLPYVVVNETSDYKKVMGLTFSLKPFDESTYQYELYVPEQVESVQVKLFDPNSLMYKGNLLELTNVEVGMNKGEMDKDDVEVDGNEFYALIIVELEDGELAHYDTMLYLE